MNNFKIGARLGAGFFAIIMLLALIALASILSLKSGGDKTGEIINNRYAKVLLLSKVKSNTSTFGRNLRDALLASSNEERNGFLNTMKRVSADNAEVMDQLAKLLDTSEGTKLFNDISEARAKYADVVNRDVKLIEDGDQPRAAAMLLNEVMPAETAFFAGMDHFNDLSTVLMDRAGKEGIDQAGKATVLVAVLSVVATLLAALIGALITRSITGPLKQAVAAAQAVAIGDLTSRIEVSGRDETALLLQSTQDMIANLRKIVGDVRLGTEAIAAASGQIASGNLDLSSRTEEQASSLEETASSMEELTGTVKQNAENAHQVNRLAVSASAAATEGGAVVGQVVETMNSIKASAARIADIIGVIDGIAFQTNILALNAAVEAARAGEQGRGFAVVASEVRNLAHRSAAAAKEIKTLIGDSVATVENGSEQVDLAGATMQKIVDSVRRMTDLMGDIASASEEQSCGIDQINQAIMQMDDVTQQNAALVEEAAAAAASLENQAAKLVTAVGMFKLDTNAAPAARQPLRVVPSTPAAPRGNVARLAVVRTVKPSLREERPLAAAGDWEEF